MRLLVCGGRDFNNEALLNMVLDAVQRKKGVTLLIEGGAVGADRLARQWAKRAGVPWQTFEADWKTLGRAAGVIRNQVMLDQGKPDGVIAFQGNRGTADMVRRARLAGVTVWEIKR